MNYVTMLACSNIIFYGSNDWLRISMDAVVVHDAAIIAICIRAHNFLTQVAMITASCTQMASMLIPSWLVVV